MVVQSDATAGTVDKLMLVAPLTKQMSKHRKSKGFSFDNRIAIFSSEKIKHKG
jgi:hypothetical protein